MRRPGKNLQLIGSGVVIGALLVGTSLAVTSKSFRYNKAKTGYLSVSPLSFGPDSGPDVDFFQSWGNGLRGVDACFNAGVQLPHGARMKSITYYFTSTNDVGNPDDDDFYGEITKTKASAIGAVNFPTSTPFAKATPVNDTGDPAAITKTIPSTHEVVNNRLFEYGIGICTDGAENVTKFFGARIKYTYRTAGD